MRKSIYMLVSAFFLLVGCSKEEHRFVPGSASAPGTGNGNGGGQVATEADYSGLMASNHPRIFMDDAEFAEMKVKVSSGNDVMVKLHEAIMTVADGKGMSSTALVKKFDGSGRRMLSVSQEALLRIFSCAYAYRYTGEDKYLNHAENDIVTVCGFDSWNSKNHFLDTGEMTAAVALGYDWLYSSLSEDTRKLAETKIKEYAFDQAEAKNWNLNFYANTGNWNQVCNGGLVLGALAVFETCSDKSRQMIEAAAESNVAAMEVNYSPDGNYPEGPGYWRYGTVYQVAMLTALETTVGTDFGLSAIPGFDKTGKYVLYTIGTFGKVFNYADNVESEQPNLPLWYFADKFDQPEVLYFEKRLLDAGKYPSATETRLLPMIMAYANRLELSDIQTPSEHVFVGQGQIPVAMVHSDWTLTETDKFLGIKGGYAAANHGHMDAGSFIFDAEGVRWSMDMPRETYANIEVPMKQLGGALFTMTQESMRWDVTRMNNHYHSTLTINGANHLVKGSANIVKTLDTEREKGAVLDMDAVFANEAKSVTRTVRLVKDADLEILDEVTALDGKEARIRWTMVSTAVPSVSANRIQLVKGTKVRYLSAASSGPKVQYKTWSVDPEDFGKPINQYEKKLSNVYLLGFEATVPAGETASFKVTLSQTK